MQGEATQGRVVWTVTGADALTFLQGMVSNDLLPLAKAPGIVWAALLTPQGKYLADFFVVKLPDGPLLIDIAEPLAPATLRRLTMYRLRADVQIAPSPLHVQRGLGDTPANALPDPRHPALGWRAYTATAGSAPAIDWAAIRVAHAIPESGIELIPDDSYLLEHGFERLHGVDFRKGCYVGQEVTARMKHKTELKKGLVRVRVEGEATSPEITTAEGKPAGTLFTRSGDRAIAYLRLDRADGPLAAGAARVTLDPDQPQAPPS
ncbi:folate-binding protein YgfZ [Gemmobacter aquarius]|uniref:Folate-binding protein YgfZ n=1 Tax=Paragemmobacter aquarius TaxID=2169400 RepID=A0A2S0UJU8_9RHOB|nr:folate-binding protein YgfZ [Gemmobacter aquarius]AWB48061.1 folate-binding protein YgfZ [Gemmobacter aquarius]